MTDNFDQELEVEILSAALTIERQETGDILKLLAFKLQRALPQNTQVQRQWFGLGAVTAVTLCFNDHHYQINRDRYGSITAKVMKLVGGVKIKTTEVSVTEWRQAVAATLVQVSSRNTEMREALSKFILG
ncbi:MAG: hypothetical protein RMX68_015850 [Aulosira sp. ZfuVER01]|nr:hypothetical protein [Aulosira sp. ZfuVER01]MDZ8002280.1 hypothetical protein [Aulosira sp. DedVER01a]MDZ8052716.1 hypothetical protein [Aulosira sp. ZfuCHP01]